MRYTEEEAKKLQENANRGIGAIARRKLNDALKPLPSENFVELHSLPARKLERIMGNPIHPEVLQFVIRVEPMGAVRMTRADKYPPRRPAVQRYFDFQNALQLSVTEQTGGEVPAAPDELIVRAFITMPASWSKKKKAEMDGKPHKQRPDRDNIDKAVADALFAEDSGIWKGGQEKRWCKEGDGRIEIEIVYH